MEVHDYLRILQTRWKIVAVTSAVVLLGALGASLLATPPQYQASTRLFVSTSSGASVSEIYQAIASRRSAWPPIPNCSRAPHSRSAPSTASGSPM